MKSHPLYVQKQQKPLLIFDGCCHTTKLTPKKWCSNPRCTVGQRWIGLTFTEVEHRVPAPKRTNPRWHANHAERVHHPMPATLSPVTSLPSSWPPMSIWLPHATWPTNGDKEMATKLIWMKPHYDSYIHCNPIHKEHQGHTIKCVVIAETWSPRSCSIA